MDMTLNSAMICKTPVSCIHPRCCNTDVRLRSTNKNIFPTGKPTAPNSALENGGLVLLGDPNLGEPFTPGPIEQYESDGSVYLVKPGVEDIYQWNITGQLTWYTPGQGTTNAAIRVDVNAP